jgi:hypothetical protein
MAHAHRAKLCTVYLVYTCTGQSIATFSGIYSFSCVTQGRYGVVLIVNPCRLSVKNLYGKQPKVRPRGCTMHNNHCTYICT